MNYLAPATDVGLHVHAQVVKAGRRQVFTHAELHAEQKAETTLVAITKPIPIPVR